MQHPNKNRLLDFFYNEASEHEIQEIREHLHSCVLCQNDLQMLKKATNTLKTLPVEKPAFETLDLILEEIKPVKQKPVREKQLFSAFPYFQIALAIPFILAVIYFLQSRLVLLPLWRSLQEFWIIKTIGSFGVVAVLFFLLGSFLTLTLAPILLFDSEDAIQFKQIAKLSWR